MHIILVAIFLIWLLSEYGWVKVGAVFGLMVVAALTVVILAEKKSRKRRRRRRIARAAPSQSGSAFIPPKRPQAHVSSSEVGTNDQLVTRGIIIRAEHLDEILSGHKIWEMRSRPFKGRETIGLVQKGSKAVCAVADVVDCEGPLSRKQLDEGFDRHRIEPHQFDDPKFSKYKYAWVLENVRRLISPVPYMHKSGAVIFVRFDAQTSAAIEESLAAPGILSSADERDEWKS